MVGGALHGKVVPIGDPTLLSITNEEAGITVHYTRRNAIINSGNELTLFVHGEPSYAEVDDAVRHASMCNTGRLRILDADALQVQAGPAGTRE